MQGRRVAVATVLTGLLLLLDGVTGVLGAESLAGPGLQGAGVSALISVTLAFAFVDAGVTQWRTLDDTNRMGLVKLGLLGLVWGFWRVSGGGVAIVPAIVGMTWVVSQAALFSTPDESDEPHGDDDLEETARELPVVSR